MTFVILVFVTKKYQIYFHKKIRIWLLNLLKKQTERKPFDKKNWSTKLFNDTTFFKTRIFKTCFKFMDFRRNFSNYDNDKGILLGYELKQNWK